ncbi:HupE/UreJ protein [Neolewinella xylanilytica]|uniref:HupE/UreJ protein n=1 Tax=Neolewinella xylanilytica TaxID=1514080 RepID=A0A2S6I254_9BACT|nr:HupE/UreJ family protein [Neolewinella xylanilytica]PPK85262.1 HupE/UreJ protein [Neolewinella xylanilytica]
MHTTALFSIRLLPGNKLVKWAWLVIVCLFFVPPRADAHVANQSYVYFRILQDSIHGSVQLTVADVNKALDLGLVNGMTEAELRPYMPALQDYLRERLEISSVLGAHPITFTDEIITLELRNGYVVGNGFTLGNTPSVPDALNVRFNPIYDVDPTHRTFALIEYNWKAGIHDNESMISLRFAPGDDGPKVLDLSDVSIWKGVWAMIVSGMYHIYIGLDHILFLIALLLPAVVHRTEGGGWRPVERFRPAFLYVLKIVTFFTIAHTITLSLAALGLVSLPGYLVESLIALSIALAAAHNLRPLFQNDGMIIAFVFGLFHGFGFASVLGEVGLRGEFMTWSLLGFNVGVELAQVLIICLVFPLLFFLRRTWLYRYLLYGGSIGLIVIAMYWFVERFFEVNIPVYWIVEGVKGIFQ